MTSALLHTLHAAIVVVGVIVVQVLLRPVRTADRRRLTELRRAAEDGMLIEAARVRAIHQLQLDAPAEVPLGSRVARRALWMAAMLTLLAAAVHAGVGPEHFREGLRFGLFFVALSIVQLVLAAVLVRRPSRRIALFAVVVNLGTAVLWAITRTVGLPFGLAEVESVGAADLTSTIAEVLSAGAALYWLAVRATRRGRPRPRFARGLPVVSGAMGHAP